MQDKLWTKVIRAQLEWRHAARREEGLEAIEWIAMGGTVVVLIGLIMAVFGSQGTAIGELITTGIKTWAGRIGGGQ